MNATVTKSASRRGVKSAGNTAAPARTAAAKAASPAQVRKKTASGAASESATAPKSAAAATKSIAKPTQSTVKSNLKPAAKTAGMTNAKGTISKAAAPSKAHGKSVTDAPPKASKAAATDLKRSSSTSASKVGSKETSIPSMSGNNARDGLMDTMEKPVVSKVSEVATKTTKPTPAVQDGTLLTEEQILQMNEKDYMNEAQLAFFKARLQQLERDLLKNAGETTEHLRETVLVPDPADRATIEEEHALELRTRDRERKLLKKVQQAIASIDAGDYGWCEETGEPIGIPRLLARPTATLSLEAQQRRELKQKLYGD